MDTYEVRYNVYKNIRANSKEEAINEFEKMFYRNFKDKVWDFRGISIQDVKEINPYTDYHTKYKSNCYKVEYLINKKCVNPINANNFVKKTNVVTIVSGSIIQEFVDNLIKNEIEIVKISEGNGANDNGE